MTLEINVENISPSLAKKYLEQNTNNRHIRPSSVNKYARDMTSGKWKLTGEPIQFSKDGRLLNGQHRLAAIVKSNKPVKIVVMKNVDDSSVAFMDTGAKRSFADVLKMRGYKNVNVLASSIRFAIRYENGWMRSNETPTHGEMLSWIQDHEDFVNSTYKVALGKRMRRFFPAPASSYIHYFTMYSMPGEFDAFMAEVLGETSCKRDSPAGVYRRYMENHMLMKMRKVNPVMLQAILVKAFNAYIEGKESVSSFSWRSGGSKPESFPTILTEHPK